MAVSRDHTIGGREARPGTGAPGAASSGPLLAGFCAGLTTLLITCLSGAALYIGAQQALQSEVRANLVRTATVAATLVDGDIHGTFTSPRQEKTPAYLQAIAPLNRIQKAAGDIKYVYTCTLRRGQVCFVLDPTPPGTYTADGVEEKSHIMQPYPEASPIMRAVLRTGVSGADVEPLRDQWGTFISGFAPLRDGRGRLVGIVGVDLSADRYVARLAAIRRAGLLGAGMALILASLTGIGVFLGRTRDERGARLLREARDEMEARVGERTADLGEANRQLQQAYTATITGWSRALDLRDEETQGHSERVTMMTLFLASSLGVAEGALIHIERGALLHDIGKMGVPDRVLLKPGPLDDGEWELMRRHPALAHEMLAPVAFLRPALDIPFCHHEKWDGTGYPRCLRGEQIPLAARLFAVVDVWDALRSDRPYRKAWEQDRVLDHIRGLAGTHFDPQVVTAFLTLMAEDEGGRSLALAA